jgi:hypothetical protein
LNQGALLGQELQFWLLDGEPWAVYRTLIDLVDCDDDERVAAAGRAVSEHRLVKMDLQRFESRWLLGKAKGHSHVVAEEGHYFLDSPGAG